jgi:signal transduction histidine kinase/ActR/RegA family two-component response regulator
VSEVEQLREALASAQQLVSAQALRLRHQELVLNGIQAISPEADPVAATALAYEVLGAALHFDQALVLEPAEDGYVCISATRCPLVGRRWPASPLFARVASGRGAVIPDLARVPGWCEDWGPGSVGCVLAPIATTEGPGLLIVCADRHGAYSADDLALVTRMGLLVSQTLAVGQQRRLAEAMRRSEVEREAAVRANEVKSRFFANMSHEIRTPLNGVVAMADLLFRAELGPREREMVGVILSSGRMLERLLNDVLDFAKMESGRLDLELRPVDLLADLKPVFDLFAANAQEKGLYLRVASSAAAAGAFEIDSLRVRQVVSNLLSNAVKFTEAGGVDVEIDATPGEDGATIVLVRVRDSGPGFAPDAAERLFERFEQEDGSTTRRFGGSGLGLSIARTLARLMGGDVRCEAVAGQGAAFEFSFTTKRVAAIQSTTVEVSPQGGERPLRVLVADDNATNRQIVGMILELIGAQPRYAENGEEACGAMRDEAFDVVLMDLQMPVMDGLTAIRTIREWEARGGRPRTPVIALSANAMTHHVVEALDAGADAHVGKPINPSALLSAMRELTATAAEEPGAASRAERN